MGGTTFEHIVPEADVNEVLLFHGTLAENLDIICKQGFDERVANRAGLYGEGVYFGCESCKSFQYTDEGKKGPKHGGHGECVLLLCRVILGDPFYTTKDLKSQRRAPQRVPNDASKGCYDTVVVDPKKSTIKQEHHEFVVFDGE